MILGVLILVPSPGGVFVNQKLLMKSDEAGNERRGQRSTRRVSRGSKPAKAPEQKIAIDERMESSHSDGRLMSGAVGG